MKKAVLFYCLDVKFMLLSTATLVGGSLLLGAEYYIQLLYIFCTLVTLTLFHIFYFSTTRY